MLRKIRISLALVFFCLLTVLFLDFTGLSHRWLTWLAEIQFIPALLAVNAGVLLVLMLLTLCFGRVYCSVICPLGVFQDIVSWVAGKKRKNRFRHTKSKSWLRYGFLVLLVLAFAGGVSSIVSLLDPYATYGRLASNLLNPVYKLGNNALAYLAERADSYAFYSVDVWVKSVAVFAVSAGLLMLVSVLAWVGGRTYCNTICPVGTVLGLLSRFAYFKPVINDATCNGCGLCARNCKASCIDSNNHSIDYSRCVVCMDCINKCHKGSIEYLPYHRRKTVQKDQAVSPQPVSSAMQNSRRSFITFTGIFAVSSLLKAQGKVGEGGLAVIRKKETPDREVPVTPPGSQGLKHFYEHCTACGLCISACPNDVLKPSEKLATFMQPEMHFDRGFCRPECTSCSEVCPTDAIFPITRAEKSSIKIGTAVWNREKCVVLTDAVECGNCARHCPTGAIEMIALDSNDPKSRKIPIVDMERCIGCGTCENLCPSRPVSAIYVEGIERHREI